MTGSWTEPAFELLARALALRAGLVFAPNRRADLEAGVRRAMRKAGLGSPAEYAQRLETGDAMWDDLIAEVTVGETYFLREPRHFDFIRHEILPALQQSRRAGHEFRVWSAGCATGEEAYSLAILFEEAGLADRTSILATDISRPALAAARRALYGPWSLRGLDAAFVERYFRPAENRHALNDRLLRRVRFEPLNLAMNHYPSLASGTWAMDLILCRNVLIYFDAAMIRAVAERLRHALAEGGWLITGPSDPPLNDLATWETVVTPAGVFYRRGPVARKSPAPRRDDPVPPLPIASEPFPTADAPPPPLIDRIQAARQAFEEGDYARAVERTRDGLDDADACAVRVRAIASLAGPTEAEREAREAASRHPLCSELRFLHAVLLMDLGRFDEAAASLRRVIYLDRSLAMGHLLLGTVLRQRGDPAGAHRAYRNALRLCAERAPDDVLPLSDGERAGRLAEAARIQLGLLEESR
ncbi:MAG: protein-glutamate O-methyltransferase CheR [Planctomycetes bacterium]|nr:protein-glutamate O-methyltransferase CheR [Planctomycetota bacterium]